MTELEVFTDLMNKTKDYVLEERVSCESLSDLCFLLSYSQVTSQTLEEVDYYEHEEEWNQLFEDYEPKAVLKNGPYLVQLNRVLDHFEPERPSAYKKIVQAILSASKYLAKFLSFEHFRKELYLTCSNSDKTLEYLKQFRKESNISNMYFVKTCSFFEQSGLLDVPVVSKQAKDYLLPLFEMEDENEKLYKKMLSLAKNNHISVYELNMRIKALTC